MTTAIKVGVLGLGGMGGSVLEHLALSERVSGVVGYDPEPERVAERRAKGVDATANLDAVLGDPDVRLVFITAPNHTHKDLALAAFAAGKAVLCEKPIATTLADAEEMVKAAEKAGLFFQIGFELRYSKLYARVKEWIDEGLLGRVVSTHCRYVASAWPKADGWRYRLQTGGSLFGEKLCHYVDVPRWWTASEVTEVYAASAPNAIPYYEVNDNYHAIYRHASGAVSHLTFYMSLGSTFRGDPSKDMVGQQRGDGHDLQLYALGTRGAALTDVFGRSLKRWAFGDSPETMTSDVVESHTWAPAEDHQYFHNTETQALDVVRRVADSLPPATPARDALATMRLVDAAERSVASGQAVRL